MPLTDETHAFAERLRIALKRAPKSIDTATALATQFNLRHPNEPITTQAAQKWLTGKAKPTPDKVETLADWLSVSAHWLRNGPPPAPLKKQVNATKRQSVSHANTAALSEKESKLLTRLRQLSEHQVFLIAELVDQLAVEREMWGVESAG